MATYVKEFGFTGTTDNVTNETTFTNATYVMDDTASLSNTCANFAGFVASFDWTLTSN